MSHLRVEVDGAVLFDGEVTDWTPPRVLPENPERVSLNELPRPVREALAKATAAAIKKATGLDVPMSV